MPAQYMSSRFGFTATATSSLTNYPASNLNLLGSHPLVYSWRSNNQTTQQDLICDMGTSKSVAAVAVLNLNVTQMQLSFSTNGSTYADFNGSQFTVAREPFGKYYKILVAQTVTARYIRVRLPAQVPVDGATYFEVGMVWIAPLLFTFPRGPQVGLRVTPRRDVIRSGRDVAVVGPWRSEEEWNVVVEKSNTTHYSALAVIFGTELPLLLYHNLGNVSEIKIARLREDITFQRDGATVSLNPVWEELT